MSVASVRYAFAPPVRPCSRILESRPGCLGKACAAANMRHCVVACMRRCAWVASSGSGGGSGNQNTLPGGFSPAEHSKERIRWTDRVAIQSQVGSAVDTLEMILAALRDNKTREDVGLPGDKRFTDEGIEALYAFAEIDVWSLRANFFGRPLDLGQFERFKTVMVLEPFAITLVGDYRILSVLSPSADCVHVRVLFSKPRSDDVVFCVTMTRVPLGETQSWMVESFLHDAEYSATMSGDIPPEDAQSATAS